MAAISVNSIKILGRWEIMSLLIASLLLLPLATIFWLSFFPEKNIWPHLIDTVLFRYIENTILLMIGVGVGSCLIGISTAWLVTMCQFPGQSSLSWLLLLPMAMPSYILAYTWTDFLEYAGPFQTFLRNVFDWRSRRDYWFPEIRSLGGAALMFSLVLYPYVYLLARSAFFKQSMNISFASRTLGHHPWSVFARIALPMARPAIVVGTTLVLMETLADYGTVQYFGINTLSKGVFDIWLNMNNFSGAAQISSLMMVFVCGLILLERNSRKHQKHAIQQGYNSELVGGYALHSWKKWGAFSLCVFPVLFGFLLPVIVLGYYAWSYFEASWTTKYWQYTTNSLLLSGIAAFLAVLLSLIIAYGVRLRGTRILRSIARLASMSYSIPGTVLALGVMILCTALDNWIDAFMREYFGISTGLLLSGTMVVIIFAYIVRFMAVSFGSVESGMGNITRSMDHASYTLGYPPGKTLWNIHVPLMRGSVLTGLLIVFVDCMKELPATLILRPFNFDTLATHIYQYASEELLEESALAAFTIVLAGMLPVILLSRSIALAQSR